MKIIGRVVVASNKIGLEHAFAQRRQGTQATCHRHLAKWETDRSPVGAFGAYCPVHGSKSLRIDLFLWKRLHSDCDCVVLLMLQEFPIVDCMTLCSMYVCLLYNNLFGPS
jgi:hypothetical protein